VDDVRIACNRSQHRAWHLRGDDVSVGRARSFQAVAFQVYQKSIGRAGLDANHELNQITLSLLRRLY